MSKENFESGAGCSKAVSLNKAHVAGKDALTQPPEV